VKVFSVTMFADGEPLGETVTRGLAEHSDLDVIDITVTQSSDAAFQCLAICVFYFERAGRRALKAPKGSVWVS
jgi:hypothetical protein